MSDKVQKIKEEIERRISQFEAKYPKDLGGYWNDEESAAYDCAEEYKRFLLFIDTLPEEPKKQPKFRVGDTIKGPCNNVFQVKEVLDTQYLLHSENGDELNSIEIVDKYSCISEEPASNDLEEEYKKYFKAHEIDIVLNPYTNCKDIVRHFAEWQKKQMMKDAVGGEVVYQIGSSVLAPTDIMYKVVSDRVYIPNVKLGDKVKLIIIKDE